MKRKRKPNAVDAIMSEIIDYGGIAARRGDAYQHAVECALARGATAQQAARCGDVAAMTSRHREITPYEVDRLIPWSRAKELGML